MPDDLRTRIAKVLHERFGPSLGAHPDGWDREPGHSREMYLEDADAVIRELRPQLAAWARMCVDSGDMTPTAQRMLHNILGQP